MVAKAPKARRKPRKLTLGQQVRLELAYAAFDLRPDLHPVTWDDVVRAHARNVQRWPHRERVYDQMLGAITKYSYREHGPS